MSTISMSKIVEACLDGIDKSFEEYFEWSDGYWLWAAPEYLLTTNIAKKIWNIKGPKFITLEDNVKKILGEANAKIKGKISQYARANGRADIIVKWGSSNVPRGIIEVKHRVYKFESFREDIDRIIEVLRKESDIQFGISTFYIQNAYVNNNEVKMEKRILNLFQSTKEYINEYAPKFNEKLYYRIYPDEEDINVWASVTIIVKK